MTGLVWQASPAGDYVTLHVTGAPVGPTTIARVDRNGYQAVRAQAGVDTAAGGAWALDDYEVALSGPVRYMVLDAAGTAVYADATLDYASGLPQLRRTHRPTTGGAVPVVTGLSGGQELRRSEHAIINRDDVVLTSFGLGKRAGTLTVRTDSPAAAAAVRDVYAAGEVVLLRQVDHAGLDMHHQGTHVEIVASEPRDTGGERRRWWDVVVTYLEVLPDDAEALGAWTLGDLDAAFPTLAAVALAYSTLGDVDANRTGV